MPANSTTNAPTHLQLRAQPRHTPYSSSQNHHRRENGLPSRAAKIYSRRKSGQSHAAPRRRTTQICTAIHQPTSPPDRTAHLTNRQVAHPIPHLSLQLANLNMVHTDAWTKNIKIGSSRMNLETAMKDVSASAQRRKGGVRGESTRAVGVCLAGTWSGSSGHLTAEDEGCSQAGSPQRWN